MHRWPDVSLAAIDLAEPMARQAKEAGINGVVTADAAEMPFRESSFDLIISSLAFQWISHDDRLFPGIASLLSPGGRLYFSTLGPGTLSELQQAYDLACRECTGRPASFRPMMGEDNLLELMARAGFDERFTMFKTVVRSYPSVQMLFKTLKGVGATLPGRPDNPPRRDVLARTVELYTRRSDAVEATYEVLYVTGRIA
jgi:malonyl-CoA O-methyltransferase